MAYGKKYIKKSVTKKTYTKKAKSTGPSMAAQIKSLASRVARLTKVAINRIQYRNNGTLAMSTVTGVGASYDARALFKFANWTRVFGTDADDEVNKVCLIRGLTGRLRMASTEPSARQYSVWVVSLKDNASELLTAGTGELATLVDGTHYIGGGSDVLLNLKFFKVHYCKRHTAGTTDMYKTAYGTGSGSVANAPAIQAITTNATDNNRLMNFILKLGKGIRVSNPAGDWKAGGYPKDPSQNYYLLTFASPDANSDFESPQLFYDTLATVEVSG